MNIISFDFGTKNIGVAVGQNLTATAYPLNSIPVEQGHPNWYLIKKVIIEWQPYKIIVGLTLNIDGSQQMITKKAKQFAELIKKNFIYMLNYMMNV